MHPQSAQRASLHRFAAFPLSPSLSLFHPHTRRCCLNRLAPPTHRNQRTALRNDDTKVDEINTILTNDITPKLDKLRGEKTHYLKWAANDAEEQRLQKFCVAYSFAQAEATLNSSEEERKELEDEQAALQAAQKEASVSQSLPFVVVCV